MRRAPTVILVLLTLASMAMGNVGLRVLHLSTDCAAAVAAADEACDHHCHDHGDGGDGGEPSDAGATPDGCATCELLLALVGLGGDAVPAPTFHAVVAVADDGVPLRLPAPAPDRALSARPPPAC